MPTVRDFFEDWMTTRDTSGRYKRTTLVRDREVVTHHVLPTLGDRLLTDLTTAEVHSLYLRLSSEVNPRTGRLIAHTARRVAVVLRKLLADAASQGLLKDNPARPVKLPSVPEEESRAFSLDEIERLLVAVRDDYKPFVLVAMLTGARFGEMRELRWKDIDFARGEIRIGRQRPTHESESVRAPKWDSIRTVDILEPVRQALESQYSVNEQALVFPAKGGGPIHPSYFRRHVWNPALLKSGTRMKPHEMRDVFVSLLIAFGEDIMRIARQTGHRHLAVFFRHYAHEIRRMTGTLSREDTYRRLMAAFETHACPEREDFLSVNQASRLLGVSRGWLCELIRRGDIPATKDGQWWIPRDALTGTRLLSSPRVTKTQTQPYGLEKR